MRGTRFRSLILAILASGAAGALFVSAAARWTTPGSLVGPVAEGSWFARTRAWFVPQGFHQAEFDAPNARHFSWTGAHAEIAVPAIDRSRAYRLRLRIAAGRPPGAPLPPQLVLSVDGVPRLRAETANAPQEHVVLAPPGSGRTMVVALDLSNTFVPNSSDRRTLGVVVESVSIEPVDAKFRPIPSVLALAALSTMLYAMVAACCGFPAVWVLVIGTAVAAVHAWLLGLDAAFLGLYAQRMARIAVGAGVLGALVGLLRWRWKPAFAPEWSIAVGTAVTTGALKLAFFNHAAATIGDGVFQVHRAQYVAAGNYFFTSITPRPFLEFPYAIALYVTAMPFWNWFPGELDRVLLLRGLSIAADSLVGVAMYFALRRAWGQPWPAVFFAALWPFAQAPQAALCTANLTNLYGQAVFGLAMGLAGWMAAGTRVSAAAIAGVIALFAISFLSHFSTIAVGVPLASLAAVLLVGLGQGVHRRLGAWLLVSVVAAAAVSYVVYYSHFHDVYQKTIERVAAREGEAEARSIVAPASVKFARWRTETRTLFGLPLLACAVVGAGWLVRRYPRDGLTTIFAGWALTWLALSVLGILTAIELRAGLAAAPLLLALAAFALGSMARTSRAGAIAASLVALAIAWGGFDLWRSCLGV